MYTFHAMSSVLIKGIEGEESLFWMIDIVVANQSIRASAHKRTVCYEHFLRKQGFLQNWREVPWKNVCDLA